MDRSGSMIEARKPGHLRSLGVPGDEAEDDSNSFNRVLSLVYAA